MRSTWTCLLPLSNVYNICLLFQFTLDKCRGVQGALLTRVCSCLNIFPLYCRSEYFNITVSLHASTAVVSMFTMPVVYEKHQVGIWASWLIKINQSLKNVIWYLHSFFLLFSGTNWSVCWTNTDPGQLCGGEVSVSIQTFCSKFTSDIYMKKCSCQSEHQDEIKQCTLFTNTVRSLRQTSIRAGHFLEPLVGPCARHLKGNVNLN